MGKEQKSRYLISIVGPTAVGKTSTAIYLAKMLGTEIISADSRQFFREMSIGTAKPTPEELRQVRHHFVDSLSVEDDYNAGKFERDALSTIERLFASYSTLVMVGGSGLYCRAVWEGLDEMPAVKDGVREGLNQMFERYGLEPLWKELSEKDPDYFDQVDRANHQRVIRALEVIRSTGLPFSKFRGNSTRKVRSFYNIKIGLSLDRQELYSRIDQRMDQMIKQGLFEEAKRLYPYRNNYALQTVGYQEIFPFFTGEYDHEEAVRLLKRNSRRYAKRQLTWYKKDQEIQWFSPGNPDLIVAFVKSKLDT